MHLTESIEGIWVTALDESHFMLAEMLHDMLDKLNEALAALFKDELSTKRKVVKQCSQVGFDP